jgi:acetylornithine deacetylase/succinyl-diaminopimelate desuccinylase-like protein
VLAERGGKLGFNLRMVLETCEERGSIGLREFVAANRMLAGRRADRQRRPARDARGADDRHRHARHISFRSGGGLRPGGVHSGHWGGLTTDPAVVLTHALGAIIDRHGKILVRDWLPGNGVPASVRAVLDGCPVGGGGEAASIDPDWGEPGLTPAEKIYGWNSFIVLAMVSGRPENPVNAVAPNARAHCQIRYTVDSDPATFADRCASIWMPKGSAKCGSRTPASACRRAAPIRRIPGCAGPSQAWNDRLASGCR